MSSFHLKEAYTDIDAEANVEEYNLILLEQYDEWED